MTIQKLASLIAKREGKKHQASIGDVREILKIICEIEAEHEVLGKDRPNEACPVECIITNATTYEARIRKRLSLKPEGQKVARVFLFEKKKKRQKK